ncbi:hypothetical protein RB195_011832 [Necator americanus]|uniref:Uncharacterized protein n=1 Tax=Necator americanus TaxID=51031 RepID=A0ABR1D471_NECAM
MSPIQGDYVDYFNDDITHGHYWFNKMPLWISARRLGRPATRWSDFFTKSFKENYGALRVPRERRNLWATLARAREKWKNNWRPLDQFEDQRESRWKDIRSFAPLQLNITEAAACTKESKGDIRCTTGRQPSRWSNSSVKSFKVRVDPPRVPRETPHCAALHARRSSDCTNFECPNLVHKLHKQLCALIYMYMRVQNCLENDRNLG